MEIVRYRKSYPTRGVTIRSIVIIAASRLLDGKGWLKTTGRLHAAILRALHHETQVERALIIKVFDLSVEARVIDIRFVPCRRPIRQERFPRRPRLGLISESLIVDAELRLLLILEDIFWHQVRSEVVSRATLVHVARAIGEEIGPHLG